MCSVTVNIHGSPTPQRIPVSLTGEGRVCLRCLNANGMTSTQTQWFLNDMTIIDIRKNLRPDIVQYFAGVLVLLPGVLGNGSAGEYFIRACTFDDFSIISMTLYSTGE